jgi:hypothetical protein
MAGNYVPWRMSADARVRCWQMANVMRSPPPPVLGGEYAVENVWVAPWPEWFAFTADLFQQTEAVPDGATISLNVVD